ncbi:MAG: MBL fold metallo-hydrolase [Acidimicrobiales bacterium]|nr:MBL fold metallo-hydrolase [Acidimicrobiales bacterium]
MGSADEAVTPLRRRQEQEPAVAEVDEVAPGILRMQLPVNFTGLGHVNMYGLVDRRGLAVVDPGMPEGTSWDAIADRLASAGFRVEDVHTVVVTHSHPDHFGGAGRLAELASARVVTHASFRVPWLADTGPDVAELDAASGSTGGANGDFDEEWLKRQAPWSARTVELTSEHRAAGSALLSQRLFPPPVPTHRLADGDVIELGERSWFALHTPGHTADHLCLHDPLAGVLLTGDHVLPSITPHIGGLGAGPDPLADYVSALDRVGFLPDLQLALPAHGQPFSDVAGRVAAIKDHHRERLDELRRVGTAIGAATVEDFARRLFKPDHWGLMAESETYAHLEHLRLASEATVVADERGARYRIG